MWSVCVGAVRPAHPASELPLRWHGEPLPYLCYSDTAGKELKEGMRSKERNLTRGKMEMELERWKAGKDLRERNGIGAEIA